MKNFQVQEKLRIVVVVCCRHFRLIIYTFICTRAEIQNTGKYRKSDTNLRLTRNEHSLS